MASVRESIEINVPVAKAFAYVTNPENWTRYVTSLTEVRDFTTPKVEQGMAFVWDYRMLGMKFGGKGMVDEFVPNQKFAMKMEGGIPIREVFEFSDKGGKTLMTFSIEYEIPNKILSIVANSSVVEGLNAKEVKSVLEKVKVLCET